LALVLELGLELAVRTLRLEGDIAASAFRLRVALVAAAAALGLGGMALVVAAAALVGLGGNGGCDRQRGNAGGEE
jgi:hypothetical protein